MLKYLLYALVTFVVTFVFLGQQTSATSYEALTIEDEIEEPRPTPLFDKPADPEISTFTRWSYPPMNNDEEQDEVTSEDTSPTSSDASQEEESASDDSSQTLPQTQTQSQQGARTYIYTPQIPLPLEGDPSSWRILWIGDSVSAASATHVKALFPNLTYDALAGRTVEQGISVASSYKEQGGNWDCIVLELGANTWALKEDFRSQYLALLAACPDNIPIFAMTIRTSGTHHDAQNDAMKEIAEADPRISIIDWYGATANNLDCLSDGCHPIYGSGTTLFANTAHEQMKAAASAS